MNDHVITRGPHNTRPLPFASTLVAVHGTDEKWVKVKGESQMGHANPSEKCATRWFLHVIKSPLFKWVLIWKFCFDEEEDVENYFKVVLVISL